MIKQIDRRRIILIKMVLLLCVSTIAGTCFAAENQKTSDSTVVLTEEEKQYIKENPVVSIAIDTSWVPYEFLASDGGCGGIIPNVMAMVGQRTGLQVKFVAKESYSDAIIACNSGETMLVSGIADDQKMATKNDVTLTDPYIEIGYSAISKDEIEDLYAEGANYRVALCVGTYAKMAMEAKMSTYEFEEYHSNQECLDAVMRGDADLALVANYSAGYFGSWHEYSRLQKIQINDFQWQLCFGVNKDADPRLVAIINKGIATVSENDLNQAIYSGATEATAAARRFSDIFYERPLAAAAMAATLVALLAVMLFVIVSQRRKAFEDAKEKTRKELQESADIINAAMISAQMSVWSYDLKSHTITEKQAAQNMHGFGTIVEDVPESLIASGYIHPDSVVAYRKAFELLSSAKEPIQGDYLIQTADRSGYMWERMILTPVWENGVVAKAIGTSTNITARKEKENEYLKLVDEMAVAEDKDLLAKGRYNLSKNYNLYYARHTESGLSLPKDFTYDYALTQLMKTFSVQEDCMKMQMMFSREKMMLRFADGQTEGSFKYLRLDEKGVPFWALLKYSMFEEPNDGDIILFIYAYNISDRVLENRILSQLSNNEYEAMTLIDLVTRRYTIKGRNLPQQSSIEAVEGDYDRTMAKRIRKYVLPDQQAGVLEQFSIDNLVKVLNRQKVFEVVYSTQDEDGSVHRKRSHFSYLDETKQTIFYYRMDITAQYNREQQQLVQTENALQQAKEASESKTKFFSQMSHDMRTPMNGILGMVDLSEDENDPQILKQNMAKIKSSGQYLLGLINDTLDFQKIESGKMTLEPQIVYMKEWLDSITEMIETTADEKGIQFTVDMGDIESNGYIKADPLRMKQIFINLLSNAVKFTPEGGNVGLVFKILGRDGMIFHARVKVSDTGIGMSQDFLQNRIFKPFSQEYNKATMHYAGTGLGLSIAKSLVELMDGRITVESELGIGTTFTVDLDVEGVEAGAYSETARENEVRQNNALDALKGAKILLAEDHPLNAEIATKLLKKAGCMVTWAKDGQECVDLFNQSSSNQYDVILMDVRMPVMDGLEATRVIRLLDREDAKSIPIIAATANAYSEDVSKCLAAGMNAHIAKPIEPLAMYETIAKYVKV